MPRSPKRHDRKPHFGGTSKSRSAKKPRKQRPRAASAEIGEPVRLQKVLAAAGIGSRRHCEELIREGRVEVDGKTVTEMGTRVDPDAQQVRVDGELLRRPKKQYFLVNKPTGILSTSRDPSGRARVIDLAPSNERLFTVGRLDKSSEGLIVVTNDGQLTDLLTHPRYGVEKRYLAQVAGVPSPETIAKLRRGVQLSEGFAHAKRVYVRRSQKHSSILEIVLDEGRNREVRRLLARVGHKVMKLRRTAIGPLRLADLKPGESRPLKREEVEELYRAAREGRRKKAQERHERRATSKLQTAESAESTAGVHPIIDKSLPVDVDRDENESQTVGSEVSLARSTPVKTHDDLGEDDFFGLTDAPDFTEDDFKESSADEGTAPVDLRPFARGQLGRQNQPTVIGGDQPRKSRRRGNTPRSQGKGRSDAGRGKSGGKSAERNKGRRA